MNQLLSSTQQNLPTLVSQTVQFSTTEPTAIISPTDFIDSSQSNVQFSTNEPTAIINPTDFIDSSQSNDLAWLEENVRGQDYFKCMSSISANPLSTDATRTIGKK
ncbi:uncharacterized protein LOC113378652 [Ctenocephalides felis]|uniref:uncharacterized protein LOC113378652 n=1 Tax=Ctenocephalides felis TaxID=7515 RepID=UPI000E6E3707|nr:uncharacterized protein LOC113378652 [Ctenocephalides felis]